MQDTLDPDIGRYTVKRYDSEKVEVDGNWVHSRIFLRPINPDYAVIELDGEVEGSFRVVGAYVGVLG